MTTVPQKNKSGFFIGVTCPGCGGRLELQADFFILTCNFCGSILRIKMPDIPPAYLMPSRKVKREIRFLVDRYLKQNGLPLTGSNSEYRFFYYPYWKIDAVMLKIRNKVIERQVSWDDTTGESKTIKERKTDINLAPYVATMGAGAVRDGIPYTIGMRAEYIKVMPFSKENIEDDFECEPVIRPWEDIKRGLEKNVRGINSLNLPGFGTNKSKLFHPVGSVIYFPYCLIETSGRGGFLRILADAISGRVVHIDKQKEPFEPWVEEEDPHFEFGQLDVDFHRCYNCGVDLPDTKSYVYICDNCHQITMLDKNRLMVESVMAAYPPNNKLVPHLFPFWSIKVSPDDAAELQRMFGGIYNSDRLAIPAFKIQNFEAIYRLTKKMSSAFPKLEMEPVEQFDDRFNSVSVSMEEALILADIVIRREKTKLSKVFTDGEIPLNPEEVKLFFAPFHPEHYFYIDSILGAVTFEKTLAG